MVTPPYKAGAEVFITAISEDGSRVVGESLAAFAGTGNLQALTNTGGVGAPYAFERTNIGWMTTSLSPFASVFPEGAFIPESLTPNLERSLWLLRPSIQPLHGEEELYTREPNGTYTLIGPVHGPGTRGTFGFRFAGASDDLSHVLFYRRGTGFWLGDPTESGESSLYEYAGADDSEPALVGVRNDGPLHGSPDINDDAELISQCGTYLGSLKGSDTYNAVSESGSTAFFTPNPGAGCPAVAELYARVDGEGTVAISSPSHPLAQGHGTGPTECDSTCEAASHTEGIFQGASRNGAKVFFLTEQPLLNSDEDSATDLYEAEIEGQGQYAKIGKLVQISYDAIHGQSAEVQGVARVSEDGSYVYFVARGVLTPAADRSLPAGHNIAVEGEDNLYAYNTVTDHTAFVATLSGEDQAVWSSEDDRPAQTNVCTPTEEGAAACVPGRFLVFSSVADLVEGDTSDVPQIFEYDVQTGTLVRVSIGHRKPEGYECPTTHIVEEGYNCDGNTTLAQSIPSIPRQHFTESSDPSADDLDLDVSGDGSRVLFASADALTPQVLADEQIAEVFNEPPAYAENVYEYDAGNVYLISDGRDTQSIGEGSTTTLRGTDPSGDDVFFETADQLVPQDTDTEVDLYDARIGGGFPPSITTTGCSASACQASSAAPSLLSAGSDLTDGGGNLPPAKPPVESKAKRLTRSQKLSKSLRACGRERGKQRNRCVSLADRRYGRRK